MAERILRMGMVGGGRDAFIGSVHRAAACLDGGVAFVAGALSATSEKAIASGRDLGLDDRRNYGTWPQMLEGELALPPEQRIDFVAIVTPNDIHFPVAEAFAKAGIHVVCDKPLAHSSDQAQTLMQIVRAMDVVFAVTYNYSGYPMVKQARQMVCDGDLGDIRKIIVEYHQGWLTEKLEATGQKQAQWRTDPDRAGLGGAIGDIGSHAEHLVSYVTGLEVEAICADLTSFVPGRRLDDDASLLIRYTNGARGVLCVSQVCVGSENDLRLRVWGTKGGLEWRQEEPNHLVFKPAAAPERIYRRGNQYACPAAANNTRLPSGHPEAFLEAFANVYNAVGKAIRAGAGADGSSTFDYPDVCDGARGVHFIERTVASGASEQKWTDARPTWIDAMK